MSTGAWSLGTGALFVILDYVYTVLFK